MREKEAEKVTEKEVVREKEYGEFARGDGRHALGLAHLDGRGQAAHLGRDHPLGLLHLPQRRARVRLEGEGLGHRKLGGSGLEKSEEKEKEKTKENEKEKGEEWLFPFEPAKRGERTFLTSLGLAGVGAAAGGSSRDSSLRVAALRAALAVELSVKGCGTVSLGREGAATG